MTEILDPRGSNGPPDPALTAVVANRMASIADLMAETMLRTARSAIFQALDFATGIFTADGRWVATKDYIPVLAGSLPSACAAIRSAYEHDVHPGDVFILNDPHHGNNHPPDVTVMKPVFHDGALRYWTLSKGHQADVGGSGVTGYDPAARDCWDEALRIPPVRLYHRGEYQREVWSLILANLRLRELVEGDLHCQVGAVTVGEQRIVELLDKIGPDAVATAVDRHLEASRAHMRAELRRIPDGHYEGTATLDDGGERHPHAITIRVGLTVDDGRVVYDFTGTDDQVEGFANSTLANTTAACLIATFGIVDPDLPINSGSVSAIELRTRPGSLAHAVEPAATTLNTSATCDTIVAAIGQAFGQAAPELASAGWWRGWLLGVEGRDERTGRPFAALGLLAGGGAGAVHGYDGWDALGNAVAMGGGRMLDPELHELGAPFSVLAFGLEPDSAGPGRWRGGLGTFLRWRAEQDGLPLVSYGSGALPGAAPYGVAGGGRPAPNRVTVERADGGRETLAINRLTTLAKGDVVEASFSGGGGWGDPREREREAVAADLRNGLISADAARRDYGFEVGSR